MMCKEHNNPGYCPVCSKRAVIEHRLGKRAAEAFDAGYKKEYIKLTATNMRIAYEMGRNLAK